MRQAATLELYFGGPGSGCHGENCGRPSTGKVATYPQKPKVGEPYRIDGVYHSSSDGNAKLADTGVFFHSEKEQSRVFGEKTKQYNVVLYHPYVYNDDMDMMNELESGRGPFDKEGARLLQQVADAHEKIGYTQDPYEMAADKGMREAFRQLDSYIRKTFESKGYDGVLMSPNWNGHVDGVLQPMVEVRKFDLDGVYPK